MFRDQWRPEEGIGFPGTEVTGGCALCNVSAGVGNETQALRKNSNCSSQLGHVSTPSADGMSKKLKVEDPGGLPRLLEE